MLGITYHNPATISVFLDRMRFRDCFISSEELRKGEWQRKLKSFVDLPSDGRDRVVFVESFATLQALLQNGAALETVKVAVYDDCNVLSNVPGASIVDAHINGGSTDTWQLYTVSFEEFNDALAAQPQGVPALIRDHDIKEDDDIPEPPPVTKQTAETTDDAADEAEEPKKARSVLVMEQLLDDIERDEDDDELEDEPPDEPARLPDEPLVARPEIARGRIVVPKRPPGTAAPPEPEDEQELAADEPPPEPEPPAAVEPESEPAAEPEPAKKKKSKRKRPKKPEPPKSYELF
jgi:hypothetical protein